MTWVLLAGATVLLTPGEVLSASPRSLSGVVQTGGTTSRQPLPHVDVTLFEATAARPTVLGSATTDASGHFTINSPHDTSSSIFYVSADIGAGVEFVAVLGPDLPAAVTINELTTVAAGYSMAQFYKTGVISGNSFGLQIGAGMNDNIVASATGESSPVLLASPNADQTNSLRSTRSLANLLGACVRDRRVTRDFFLLTKPPRGRVPRTTAEALANLARNPGENVEQIYGLTQLSDLYSPPLVRMPDAWTVTVKVNDSGDDASPIGGLGNLVFDARGYAWITNNVVQGTPRSSRTMIVLKPNGKPADGTNGTAVSPVTGGGLLGGGYGITIDPQGSVWEGNFGWESARAASQRGGEMEACLNSQGQAHRSRDPMGTRAARSGHKGWQRTRPATSGSPVLAITVCTCSSAAIRINPRVFRSMTEAAPSTLHWPPTVPPGSRMAVA